MKRRVAPLIAAAAILLIGVWYAWIPGHAPAGQSRLVVLTPKNLMLFQQSFNAAPDSARLVLLLSPT